MADHGILPIRIETDLIPRGVYASARDWTGLLVTRQLTRPLFREAPCRTLVPDLLSTAERSGDTLWRLSVAPDRTWSDGQAITARDIARHWASVARGTGRFRWILSLIESVRVVSRHELDVVTRRPMGNLPALLANPILGPCPADSTVTCGAFSLAARDARRLRLTAASRGPDIEFVLADSAEHGQELYERGHTDITCCTTFPVSAWARADQYPDLQVEDLDIVIMLQPPDDLPAADAAGLSAVMDRTRLAASVHGAIHPLHRLTDLWRSPGEPAKTPEVGGRPDVRNGRSSRRGTRCYRMVFPDFSPNRHLARNLCDQLGEHAGLEVVPERISYGAYLDELGTRHSGAFRLVLCAPAWPDPAAALLPLVRSRRVGQRPENDDDREFDELVERALAADDAAGRLALATRAEDLLADGGRLIPLGRLRSATRLRVAGYTTPPSGWVDLAACTRD